MTEGEQADENNKIKYEENLLNTKFAQDAKLDLTNMLEESTEETSAMLNTMIKKMKMVYKITLPLKQAITMLQQYQRWKNIRVGINARGNK